MLNGHRSTQGHNATEAHMLRFAKEDINLKKKHFDRSAKSDAAFNPLSANFTKWPNTLKQFVDNLLSKSDDLVHQKNIYKIRASPVWHEHIIYPKGNYALL